MEWINNHPEYNLGEFMCLSFTSPQLDSLFCDEVKTDVFSITPSIVKVPEISIGFDVVEEEESSISDEWSYDERNAPRIGTAYQVDVNVVLPDIKNYEDLSDDARAGELTWDSRAYDVNSLNEYFRNTTLNSESEIDQLEPDSPDDSEDSIQSCTRETAMSVLHQCRYDVNEATLEMKNKKLIWLRKKTSSD
jgi:hypothetical protein